MERQQTGGKCFDYTSNKANRWLFVPGVRVRWPAKRRSIRLALIFGFFCIKAKEQIKNVPRSASLEKCKQMQSVVAHIAFFTGQRSDHVFKEAREKKAKIFKDAITTARTWVQ